MIFPTVFPSPENGSLFSGICVQLFHINELPYAQWPGLLLMAYGEAIKSSLLHPFAMQDIFTRVILTPIALFLYGAIAMVAANFGMLMYLGTKFFAFLTKEGEQMVFADIGYLALLLIALAAWSIISLSAWDKMLNWCRYWAAELDRRFFKYGKPLTIAVEEYEMMCKALVLLASLTGAVLTLTKKPQAAKSGGA